MKAHYENMKECLNHPECYRKLLSGRESSSVVEHLPYHARGLGFELDFEHLKKF